MNTSLFSSISVAKRSIAILSASLILTLSGCTFLGKTSAPTTQELNNQLYSYQNVITPDLLKDHLMIFASDAFMGRETATEYERMAADYLINEYKKLNLPGGGENNDYLQPFELDATVTDSMVFTLTTPSGESIRSTISQGSAPDAEFQMVFGGSDNLSGEIVFLGFGVADETSGINQVAGADIEGKWVMIYRDIPTSYNGKDLISSTITNNVRIGALLQAGATGVIYISESDPAEFASAVEAGTAVMSKPSNLRLSYRESAGFRGFGRAVAEVRADVAAEMMGLSMDELTTHKEALIASMAAQMEGSEFSFEPMSSGYTLSFEPYRRDVKLVSNNVMAFLEGSDPVLKEEVVILTSHYDHIGITLPDASGDMINNGADDDGSGTISLVGVATAFSKAAENGVRPKRSILFLNVSGEEKGLLGSRYYSDHPVYPIENTVANLNSDMVGRSDDAHLSEGVTEYVYLIGGPIISSGLDSLVTVANQKTSNVLLDYHYNDLNDPNQFYRRSDHWNFGRLGIPFSFFFTGVHEDYHRPSDHPEKIDYNKLSKISQVIFGSAIELANAEQRPVVDNQEFIEKTQAQPR